jgi:RNA polymerase sigma-70 factor, ECF subfamily
MPLKADHFNTGSTGTGRNIANLLDNNSFEKLFRANYTSLCRHSVQFVRRPEVAEEIVQDQFIYIWNNKNNIEIHTSIEAYLYKAVQNKSIDYLRSRFANIEFEDTDSLSCRTAWEDPSEKLEANELKQLIKKAVHDLPEKCYAVFTMSRFGGMKNQEIAESLEISVKTVENQITIALKKIKSFLERHWMLLILLFSLVFKEK